MRNNREYSLSIDHVQFYQVLPIFPKCFQWPLVVRMYCNPLTDGIIHPWSIGKTVWQYSKCSVRFDCLQFVSEHMKFDIRIQRTTLRVIYLQQHNYLLPRGLPLHPVIHFRHNIVALFMELFNFVDFRGVFSVGYAKKSE